MLWKKSWMIDPFKNVVQSNDKWLMMMFTVERVEIQLGKRSCILSPDLSSSQTDESVRTSGAVDEAMLRHAWYLLYESVGGVLWSGGSCQLSSEMNVVTLCEILKTMSWQMCVKVKGGPIKYRSEWLSCAIQTSFSEKTLFITQKQHQTTFSTYNTSKAS